MLLQQKQKLNIIVELWSNTYLWSPHVTGEKLRDAARGT